jgi:hypothetical protein
MARVSGITYLTDLVEKLRRRKRWPSLGEVAESRAIRARSDRRSLNLKPTELARPRHNHPAKPAVGKGRAR